MIAFERELAYLTRRPSPDARILSELNAGVLDELITASYPLRQINEAIAAVVNGQELRNVIVF